MPRLRPRPRVVCPLSDGEVEGGDGGADSLTRTGGSYLNKSSGMGIVCRSSGVIGGERRIG